MHRNVSNNHVLGAGNLDTASFGRLSDCDSRIAVKGNVATDFHGAGISTRLDVDCFVARFGVAFKIADVVNGDCAVIGSASGAAVLGRPARQRKIR